MELFFKNIDNKLIKKKKNPKKKERTKRNKLIELLGRIQQPNITNRKNIKLANKI